MSLSHSLHTCILFPVCGTYPGRRRKDATHPPMLFPCPSCQQDVELGEKGLTDCLRNLTLERIVERYACSQAALYMPVHADSLGPALLFSPVMMSFHQPINKDQNQRFREDFSTMPKVMRKGANEGFRQYCVINETGNHWLG